MKGKSIIGLSAICFMFAALSGFILRDYPLLIFGSILYVASMVGFCTELILEEMRKQKEVSS